MRDPDGGFNVMIGVGCPRLIYAEWVADLVGWANSTHRHHVGIDWEQTPNRVDWSYSRIIETARTIDCDWLVLNDADVISELPFDQAFFYVRQAQQLGYEIVASPIMSIHNQFSLHPVGPTSTEEPFEVDWVTGGHWWISERVLKKLQPVAQFMTQSGKTEPMYFRIPDNTSEDVEMCRIFRSLGFKIAADPRLLTAHLKLAKLPSLRHGMKLREKGDHESANGGATSSVGQGGRTLRQVLAERPDSGDTPVGGDSSATSVDGGTANEGSDGETDSGGGVGADGVDIDLTGPRDEGDD